MDAVSLELRELRLAAMRIERLAERFEARPHRRHGDLADLRTDALGELLEALDRIEPGLGQRVHLLLYPGADALLRGGEIGRKVA
jgi:hypothetical protein